LPSPSLARRSSDYRTFEFPPDRSGFTAALPGRHNAGMRKARLAGLLVGGLICGLIWGLVAAAPTLAVEITQEGLTFSDEGGGFVLKSVTGRGSLDDPYVVTEEVTGPRKAILIVRGLRRVGNRIGTHHIAAVAITKIVVNRSTEAWQSYQMELREIETRHSPYEDGLSFGQNTLVAGAFTTSSFPDLLRYDEPQDTLGFSGSVVQPGEGAQFSFLVTDMSPVERIYIFQEPLQPVSELPPVPGVQLGALPHRTGNDGR